MAARRSSMPARRKETRRAVADPPAPKYKSPPKKQGNVARSKDPLKSGRAVTGD
jgi:hypothetical protein